MRQTVQSLHLLFAACWIGAYLAGDYLIRTRAKADDPMERVRAARAILIGLEMPLAAIVPVLGLGVLFMYPAVLSQPWFHVKLTAFVVVFGLLMVQAKRLRIATESEDPDAALRTYLILRLAGAIMFVVIVATVVFRFGMAAPVS